MSDPIAEAAANLVEPSPAMTPGPVGDGVQNDAVTTETKVNAAQDVGVAGNVLLNAAPVVDALVIETKQYSDGSTATGVAPLPDVSPVEPSRDSLLMRMHAAIDELEAKIATGAHVFAHEVSALRDHIMKVL